MKKTNRQSTDDVSPNHIAVDETVIQLDNQCDWLYAAVEPDSNNVCHVRLFPTRTTERTLLFFRELREEHQFELSLFLVGDAYHRTAALARLGLGLSVRCYESSNAVDM